MKRIRRQKKIFENLFFFSHSILACVFKRETINKQRAKFDQPRD
jgi:hypothetical protein